MIPGKLTLVAAPAKEYRLSLNLRGEVDKTRPEVPVLEEASHFFELEKVFLQLGLEAGQLVVVLLQLPDLTGRFQDIGHDLPHEGQGALRFLITPKRSAVFWWTTVSEWKSRVVRQACLGMRGAFK
jgi:hypothetical protein